MHVIEQTRPVPAPIPGIAHATWAGQADGLSQISLWRQTVAPGAATPPGVLATVATTATGPAREYTSPPCAAKQPEAQRKDAETRAAAFKPEAANSGS